MAELLLNVPLIAQRKSMSCWHASVRMIKAFAGEGTKAGEQKTDKLQKTWDGNTGLRDVTGLAKAEGFVILSHYRPEYTVESLIDTLKRHGPLWVNTSAGVGQHAIVVTGVSNEMGGDEVFINDPGPVDTGTSDIKSLEDFNKIVSPAQQMYYPQAAKK